MKKVESVVTDIVTGKILNPVKKWIADKWFDGNENLMIGFLGTISVGVALVVLYVMTDPSDALIQFVQHVFQYFGWW